jgi:hypothetical protein
MIKGTINYMQANLPNKYGNSLVSLTTLLLRKKLRFAKRTSGLKSAPTDLIIHINHCFNLINRVLYIYLRCLKAQDVPQASKNPPSASSKQLPLPVLSLAS